MSSPHLVLEGVDGHHGDRQVIHSLALDAERGETIAVLGPSGSGKTTVLRMIAGLHPVSVGTISLDGRRVDGAPAQRRGIGLVPQQGALFPHLSVADNVAFGLVPANPVERVRTLRVRRRRVAEMLNLVGLADRADDRPSQLSGGQQQRVALARALAPGTDLVLLDEPFSALDAELRGQVRMEVKALLDRAGVTSVLVTHDQTEALSLAERVAVLIDGRVVQFAGAVEIYRRPATLQVARLTGPTVVVPATAEGGHAQTPIGAVDLTAAGRGEGTVLWRPEDLRVQHAPDLEGCGRCTGLDFAGPTTTVHVELDGQDGTRGALEIPVVGPCAVDRGDRVRIIPTAPGVFHEPNLTHF